MNFRTAQLNVIKIINPNRKRKKLVIRTASTGWHGLASLLRKTCAEDFEVDERERKELFRERVLSEIHKQFSDEEILRNASSKKIRKQKRQEENKYRTDRGFYSSSSWVNLRYKVLKKYGARCQICGRTYREDGVKMHVDHIKPRSKYPELELDEGNLQILCEDCNLGKMARDEKDWR